MLPHLINNTENKKAFEFRIAPPIEQESEETWTPTRDPANPV